MRKVQFGCGGNRLVGWENFDAEVDIRYPLPFGDNTYEYILAEHVVEHITHRQAWGFFEECKRILVPGGMVRIAVPDITRLYNQFCPEYGEIVRKSFGGSGSRKESVHAAVFEHGHMAAWNETLLKTFLEAVGFVNVTILFPGFSHDPNLCNVEGHGKVVGDKVANAETSVVEGTKNANS